jgi:hypothetical protein
MRRAADLGSDVRASAKASIDEATGLESVQGGSVVREVFGLTADRRWPGEPEPRQILADRGFEGGPAARLVDVFDAKEKIATGRGGGLESGQRRKCVTPVKIAARRRREAGDKSGRAYELGPIERQVL